MRLEVSQRADLAVRALILLRRSPSRLRSADLARALGTTPGFVPQVMSPLVRAEWIGSRPGPMGGYEPIADLGALSVLQVVEEIDGPTDSGRCVVAEQQCEPSQPCALHHSWDRARRELVEALASLTIADVGAT
ncbi:MAG: Rrf2 family transcriptional regulator [Ilumatobacter sp.]|uniref:RrF2 family transcriptional regulator n=1 Tax=Ilumatobacter sp. TaxID=1967498 RepID=UPI003C74B541